MKEKKFGKKSKRYQKTQNFTLNSNPLKNAQKRYKQNKFEEHE